MIRSKEIQRERSLTSHTVDIEHKTEKSDRSSLQGVSTEEDEQRHWIHSFLASNFILPIVFSCFKRETEGAFVSILQFLEWHKLGLMWKNHTASAWPVLPDQKIKKTRREKPSTCRKSRCGGDEAVYRPVKLSGWAVMASNVDTPLLPDSVKQDIVSAALSLFSESHQLSS